MQQSMTLRALAKINLALDVLGRRPDGYHEVEMVLQSISLHDLVSLRVGGKKEIHLTCTDPEVPQGPGNLAFEAARLLKERYSVEEGVSIFINKRIPKEAGLAGGSTNAAATLKGLNRLWHLGLKEEDLLTIGQELGADVPYCLQGGTCLARGIGERLTPLPAVPPFVVVLAKPPGGLATREVYQGFRMNKVKKRPDIQRLIRGVKGRSLSEITASMGNVLEAVSISLLPEIASIQTEMLALGARVSQMTGSGPTVFGIVSSEKEAAKVKRGLQQQFPGLCVLISRTANLEGLV